MHDLTHIHTRPCVYNTQLYRQNFTHFLVPLRYNVTHLSMTHTSHIHRSNIIYLKDGIFNCTA